MILYFCEDFILSEKLKKAQAGKKPKVKAKVKSVRKAIVKKPTRVSASGAALAIVKRSRKSVDTAALKKKTRKEPTAICSNMESLVLRASGS